MNNLEKLQALTEHFDAEDSSLFSEIVSELQSNGGQIEALPAHLKAHIENLKAKYGEFNSEEDRSETAPAPSAEDVETPFALYVRNVLYRELCKDGQDLNEAVQFAFNNKWLPTELRNKEICETKYAQYEQEIRTLNQWREGLGAAQDSLNDKTMAVGLAWFMKVYQLKQCYEKAESDR